MNRNRLTSKNRNRLGAISTEYVIILVLIAVGGILAFMMLGQQAKEQISASVDKISGKDSTTQAVNKVTTTPLDTNTTMAQDGTAGQAAVGDFTVTE